MIAMYLVKAGTEEEFDDMPDYVDLPAIPQVGGLIDYGVRSQTNVSAWSYRLFRVEHVTHCWRNNLYGKTSLVVKLSAVEITSKTTEAARD